MGDDGEAEIGNHHEDDEEDRHCAFCLKSIAAKDVKKCGRCNRRVYCSKECQSADWTFKGVVSVDTPRGQGHKNWCGIQYGEEDVDWKVVQIEGKGVGVIALRQIPPKYRIMVEGGQLTPSAHPATKELMPESGTLRDKFNLNSLGCGVADEDDNVLCLRLSRVNHACKPNASHFYVQDFKVKVLFAECTIEPGEEICISYTTWNDMTSSINVPTHHNILKFKWGIICPEDCACRQLENQKAIESAREDDGKILSLALFQPDLALRIIGRLLNTSNDIIYRSWLSRKRTLYDGFQVANQRTTTLNLARRYINECFEITTSISHPNSLEVMKRKGDKDHPETHHSYLRG